MVLNLNVNEKNVLKLLQTNSRLTATDVARTLNISRTTVNTIINKLEETVIDSYTLTLKKEIFDTRINCYVLITSNPKILSVDDNLKSIMEIMELKSVAGSVDMVARIETENHQELDDILLKIARFEGVINTETLIVLKSKIAR